MLKPVMASSVEADVVAAITQYRNITKWKRWGMDTLREQGALVLLEGPTGTGKTTIARWMGKQVKNGFRHLSVADFGSEEPGASERGIIEFFEDAKKHGDATIFMDECDHLLGMREDSERTWQLSSIEMLMVCISSYPGLVICATNHPQALDPAMASRFMSIIKVGEPTERMRMKLWKQKLPAQFPLQFTLAERKQLSKVSLNGRQIEMVIINVASHCIAQEKKPNMEMFKLFCEKEKNKSLTNGA
jgi:SpoVK/Ycf46/Vps4 family AAA+-type ATPase